MVDGCQLLRASVRDVILDYALPFPLGLQDVLDGVPGGAVASGMRCDPVGFNFDFRARVLHRDREAAIAHHGQVDNVVAHKGCLGGGDSLLLDDLPEDGQFVLFSLVHVVDLQVARAQGHGFRNAFRDEPDFDAGQPRQRNSGAVVGMKALGLDESRAVKAESTLSALPGRLLEHALLGARGRGKDPNFAVGENAVNVEEDELDCAGASDGRWFGHRRDSSIRPANSSGTRDPQDWEVAAKFLEVPVGSDESGLVQYSQSSS